MITRTCSLNVFRHVPQADTASRYNENAYLTHRRRRNGNYYDAEWCVVTASGSRNGAFMECNQCYRLYGPLAPPKNAPKMVEPISLQMGPTPIWSPYRNFKVYIWKCDFRILRFGFGNADFFHFWDLVLHN